MNKYCPDWIFSAVVALIANRYLADDLGLDAFANKYSEILAKHYVPIPPDVLEEAAEGYLRVLIEAESEDAIEVLTAYSYNQITFETGLAPRKLKGMFSSAFDGDKDPKFTVLQSVRDFKAFLYMMRSKPELAAPVGWTWTLIEDGEWLKDLETVEVSILDSL